jgi:uncharacterized protein
MHGTLAAIEKERHLIDILAEMSQVMGAFSAGVDSTYLLDVAQQVLGDRVTAVTADSPSLARSSLAEATAFCLERGIRHVVVNTDEFSHEEYLVNDGNRCYHCKSALMRAMQGLARATASARGEVALLIGAIADDLGDHRPGMVAAREAGALWPLADLGFTKVDVRERSRDRDLATWNRPAEPCLSSRVPYGERVTIAGLRMIEQAEVVLKRLGFPVCRARHHHIGGEPSNVDVGQKYLCRIEVPETDLARLLPLRNQIISELQALGYVTVTIDLAGFKSGGFNALLTNTAASPKTVPTQ